MLKCVLCYIIYFKVVMATNRIETLDPALIRPGRIDRKIEFPLPDEKTKRRIFNIHTSRMTLAEDVNLTELIMSKDDLSGADIKVRFYLLTRETEGKRGISTYMNPSAFLHLKLRC